MMSILAKLTVPWSRRRSEDAIALGIAVAIAVIYFLPVLSGRSTFFHDPDALFQYYAYYQRLGRSLSNWQIPLWDPGVYGGRSFPGVGETGVFYPFNLIFLLLLGASGESLSIMAFVHAVAGSFFFYLLCRYLGEDLPSSISMGLGFSLITISSIYLAGSPGRAFGLVWTPLMLLYIFKSLEKWSYSVLAGAFLAFSLLVGHVQDFYNNAVILGVVSLLLIAHIGELRTRLSRLRVLGRVLLAVFFAMGFSIMQILAVLEEFAISYRWVGDGPIPANSAVPWGLAAYKYLLPVHALVDVLNPFLYQPTLGGDGQPFFGVVALLFAIVAMATCPRRRYLPFALLAAIGLILSLGGQTPIYWIFYSLAPLANRLREPGRFIFIFQFAACILGALGLTSVLRRVGRTRILIAIVLIVLVAGEAVYVRNQWGTFAPTANNPNAPSSYYAMNQITSYVSKDYLRYRVVNWFDALPPNIGDVYPIETTLGYAAVMNSRYYDFLNINWSPDSVIYDLLNAKYVVSKTPLQLGLAPLLSTDGLYLYERPRPMPRFWVPRAVTHVGTVSDSFNATKEFVNQNGSPWDMAIVEDGVSGVEICGVSQMGLLQMDEQYAKIHVSLPSQCYLVYSSVYYPGWLAYVDGDEVPVSPAYYALNAISLPKGSHIVEFAYKPRYLEVGFPITVAVILLSLFFILGTHGICSRKRALVYRVLGRLRQRGQGVHDAKGSGRL